MLKRACFWLLALLIYSCHEDDSIQKPELAFDYLSQYGFFEGEIRQLNPAPGVIPYQLINPLFSDYARKDRFLCLPQGTQITYRSEGALDFPQGSVLIKNFSYTLASGERHLIETRLLRKTLNGWEADAYLWNENQTDAKRHLSGRGVDLVIKPDDGELMAVHYLVPDKNQCKSCHSISGEIELIGPKARNLNLVNSQGENQLQSWNDQGILVEMPKLNQVPKAESTDDTQSNLTERARAYLDINCGHCHNPFGSARNSGLFLNHQETDPYRLGYCKVPVAAGVGTGGHRFVITPGSSESSILYFRMNSNRPSERMPELGRTVVDKQGVALIQQWIDAMPEANCGD